MWNPPSKHCTPKEVLLWKFQILNCLGNQNIVILCLIELNISEKGEILLPNIAPQKKSYSENVKFNLKCEILLTNIAYWKKSYYESFKFKIKCEILLPNLARWKKFYYERYERNDIISYQIVCSSYEQKDQKTIFIDDIAISSPNVDSTQLP